VNALPLQSLWGRHLEKTKEFLRKCYLAKYTLDEFLRNAPYKMFYSVTAVPDVKFYILDLSPKQGKPKNKIKYSFLT